MITPPKANRPAQIYRKEVAQPKVHAALDAIEQENLDGSFDIGAISIACALGYLDLRYPEEHWRETHPRLAAWFAAIGERPSVAATRGA